MNQGNIPGADQGKSSINTNLNLQTGVNMGIGYLDLMMNSMIMEQMKVVSNNNGFTFSSLLALAIILSINELKPMMGQLIKYFGSELPKSIGKLITTALHKLWEYIKNIYVVYKEKKKEKEKEKQAETVPKSIEITEITEITEIAETYIIPTNNNYEYVIKWTPKIQSAIIFLNYILKSPKTTFVKENTCNITSDKCKIKYKDIKFQYENVSIQIPDTEIILVKDMIETYSSNYVIPEIDFGTKTNPTCLCSFMDKTEYSDKMKSYVKMAFRELEKSEYSDENNYIMPFRKVRFLKKYYNPNSPYRIPDNEIVYDFVIPYLLQSKYSSINIQIVMFEMFILNHGHIIPGNDFTLNFYKKIRDTYKITIEKLQIDIELNKFPRTKYDLTSSYLSKCCQYSNIDLPNPDTYEKEYQMKRENTNASTLNLTIISKKQIDYNVLFVNQ